mmetsp:Transcript_13718/g.35011  ORF Transcript_13718/g.35011 Transcript_13718/m.35011 type:complete len:219 (-) Transcript_13718:388-1044(-)
MFRGVLKWNGCIFILGFIHMNASSPRSSCNLIDASASKTINKAIKSHLHRSHGLQNRLPLQHHHRHFHQLIQLLDRALQLRLQGLHQLRAHPRLLKIEHRIRILQNPSALKHQPHRVIQVIEVNVRHLRLVFHKLRYLCLRAPECLRREPRGVLVRLVALEVVGEALEKASLFHHSGTLLVGVAGGMTAPLFEADPAELVFAAPARHMVTISRLKDGR